MHYYIYFSFIFFLISLLLVTFLTVRNYRKQVAKLRSLNNEKPQNKENYNNLGIS